MDDVKCKIFQTELTELWYLGHFSDWDQRVTLTGLEKLF